MMKMIDNRPLTTKEAAEYCSVGRETILRWARDKTLKRVAKINKRVFRFDRAELATLVGVQIDVK